MLIRAVSGDVAVADGVRDSDVLVAPPGLSVLLLGSVVVEASGAGGGGTASAAAAGGLLIGPVTLVER